MSMQVETALLEQVQRNLADVLRRIATAYGAADATQRAPRPPRLLAVSKTKPVELIGACYAAGQRDFGENYAQELIAKANDAAILQHCPDIRWHYIGALQSNKAAKLVRAVPRLAVVETVASEKTARLLDGAAAEAGAKLDVMVQVNTSGEAHKSGAALGADAFAVASFVLERCASLRLLGFMTIGAIGGLPEGAANRDFTALRSVRDDFCERRQLSVEQCELSMGMSNDFEQAIALGSGSVRVGSTIFGYRDLNKEKQAIVADENL